MCAFFGFNLDCPKMMIHKSCNYLHDSRIVEAHKIQNSNNLNYAQQGEYVEHLLREDHPNEEEVIIRY